MLEYPVERHLTLRERIVDFVKEAIIKGRLKPGERVPEPELAEMFGISRTPIREAFRQLESEGFITFTPRKGAIVSPITDKDVIEFYAIKGLLEGYAAKMACCKISDKEIRRMEDLNSQMARCAEKNDVKNFFKLDNQLHDVFLKLCGNDKLYNLIHTIVQQFERFRRTSLSLLGRMQSSVKQHYEIIEAFKKRDVDLVERLVKANAEMGGELLAQEILKEKV
ncbi:MAG: GntR family transcriptional regulator [Deltaproteobacteria bacterium]|nr:GntR family transcriptional regulator [Deltaproteobacteria bacterium]